MKEAKVILKGLARIIETICCTLVCVTFLYTGLTKILNFDEWNFKYNKIDLIHDNNLIGGLYIIPFLELLIPIMFFISYFKLYASILSTLMMALFTIYTYYKIYISDDSLCSCGGIFNFINLEEHFMVNILLLLASLYLMFSTYNSTIHKYSKTQSKQ